MILSRFREEDTHIKVWDVEKKTVLVDPRPSYSTFQEASKYLGINQKEIRRHTNNKTSVFCMRLQKKICFRIVKNEQLINAA